MTEVEGILEDPGASRVVGSMLVRLANVGARVLVICLGPLAAPLIGNSAADPCVGVWVDDGAYVAVHASGLLVRHESVEDGAWSVRDLDPLGRLVVAAVQSESGVHYLDSDAFLWSAGEPAAAFTKFDVRLRQARGALRGALYGLDRIHRASRWLVLSLPDRSTVIVEHGEVGIEERFRWGREWQVMTPIGPDGSLGLQQPPPTNRAGRRMNVAVWHPTAGVQRSTIDTGEGAGDWGASGVIETFDGVRSLYLGFRWWGRDPQFELFRFAVDERADWIPSGRADLAGVFMALPRSLRVAGDRIIAPAGHAAITSVDARSMEVAWSHALIESPYDWDDAWPASDGETILLYGRSAPVVVRTDGGQVETESNAPPDLRRIVGKGRAGELIGEGAGDRFLVFREGGDWGEVHGLSR